jgi:integrase
MRRAILERFRRDYGARPLAEMQRKHVATILGRLRPWAARNWLKALRGLMQFAVALEMRLDDPTTGIKLAEARAGSFHTSTESEIDRFEAAHPIGSRARLAMALLLYTGQRRSDVIRMGPQHVRGNAIFVRQQKTGGAFDSDTPHARRGHHGECGHLTFLTATAGAPFSAAGFGNLFRQWCDEAASRLRGARASKGRVPPARGDRVLGTGNCGDQRP